MPRARDNLRELFGLSVDKQSKHHTRQSCERKYDVTIARKLQDDLTQQKEGAKGVIRCEELRSPVASRWTRKRHQMFLVYQNNVMIKCSSKLWYIHIIS